MKSKTTSNEVFGFRCAYFIMRVKRSVPMRHIDLHEVIATLNLEEVGITEKDYYFVGIPGEEMIEFWHPEFGPRMHLIHDTALANACRDYLRAIGAR
jgi:hypothetical protein